MKKNILYGAILLTGAGIIAKILGAIYRVPLINLIGTTGIGLFQLIFPIYALFLVISCSGIPTAFSKIVSVEVAQNKIGNIKKLFKSNVVFMAILGSVVAIFLCLFAKFFATLQGCASAYICYYALAPAIAFCCVISVFKGYFQGFQNMFPSAVVQVLEQVFKLIFALLFAKLLMKKGVVYAVFGSLLGISISELFSLGYCVLVYFFSKNNKNIIKNKEKTDYTTKICVKLLLKNSFPIMLNGTIIPLVGAIESLLVVWLLSKAGIGSDVALKIYGLEDGVVSSLINMPIVVAVAISTALIPNLAQSFACNNLENVQSKIKNSLKYVWIISLPCALIFLTCADKIIYFLYSSGLNSSRIDQFLVATNLLKFSAINIVYISVLNMLTAILQASNNSFIPVRNLLIASVIKCALNFVFVTNVTFNVYGLVITDIICFSLACVLNLKSLKNIINFNLNAKKEIAMPVIGCVLMLSVIKIADKLTSQIFPLKFATILIIGLALVIYVLSLILFGVLTKEELSFLPKVRLKKNIIEK